MKGYLAVVAAHATAGYVLAVGFAGFRWGDSRWDVAWGVALWVALASGILALRSAFDPGAGRASPAYLMELALATMVAALLLSFTLTPGYRLAFALCFLLGLLYVVPPARLEGRGGLDLAAAALGLGFLTPYAGAAAAGKSLDLVSGLVLVGFAFLAAGGQSVAGVWRTDADRRRGLATIAVKLGVRRSLWAAIWGCAAAFGMWLVAWLLRGDPWYLPGGALSGLVSLGIAFAAWMSVLLPWLRHHEAMTTVQHRRGTYQAAVAWMVTDGAIVAAFGL